MTLFILLGSLGGWCAISYIVLCAYKALHARRKTRKAQHDTFIGANITAVATPRRRKIFRNFTAQMPAKTVTETVAEKPTETVEKTSTETVAQPLPTTAEIVAETVEQPLPTTAEIVATPCVKTAALATQLVEVTA